MSDQEEFRFRRQAAERLLGEVPDWVPASIREAAPIALSTCEPDAVPRLLTDQRMRTVWRTLRRHDATKLKDLFLAAACFVDRLPQVISAHTLEPPRVQLSVLAQRIEELANDLRFRRVGGEMHRQALQELIAECRRRADAPQRTLGLLVVDRVRGDNRVRSYLVELVKFTNHSFGTPHYSTVATIARVALNKSDHEITVKMVRDANRRTKAAPAGYREVTAAEWTLLMRSRKSK